MTWQNLPCAPTLPALFAACPHGWAEIEFTYHAGNPTADPPQDADYSMEVRRLWGIENVDEPALVDLLEDLQEPPLGMPHRDCILLARMEHRAGPCGICMRGPEAESHPGAPCMRDGCMGEFTTEPRLRASWGVDGRPVVFVGTTAEYGLAAALKNKRVDLGGAHPPSLPPGYEWSGDSHEYVHAVGTPSGPPLWGPITLREAWERSAGP